MSDQLGDHQFYIRANRKQRTTGLKVHAMGSAGACMIQFHKNDNNKTFCVQGKRKRRSTKQQKQSDLKASCVVAARSSDSDSSSNTTSPTPVEEQHNHNQHMIAMSPSSFQHHQVSNGNFHATGSNFVTAPSSLMHPSQHHYHHHAMHYHAIQPHVQYHHHNMSSYPHHMQPIVYNNHHHTVLPPLNSVPSCSLADSQAQRKLVSIKDLLN